MLTNNIPGGLIVSQLLKEIMGRVSDEKFHYLVIEEAAKYENMMQQGSKQIMFIEAFLAQVMVLVFKKNRNLL